VTQLRNKMLEELRRRNYSPRSATTYIRVVGDVKRSGRLKKK
jgi:hypothetical protein